jgi:hypothetical protein
MRFWNRKPPKPPALVTKEVGPDERRELLKTLTGGTRAVCDLCRSRVTQGNLATWDQDGNVYCDQHTHKVVQFKTGDVYHHLPVPPVPRAEN